MVLWRCIGEGGGDDDDQPEQRRGYYLQFQTPASVDVNSSDFRRAWMQSPALDEASLNQLSAEALLTLLAPVLEGC